MKTYKKLLITFGFVLTATALLTTGALADNTDATVTASALNMRSGPSTDYDIITVAPRGATVVVESDTGAGWYQVQYNGSSGCMYSDYLTFSETAGTEVGAGAISGTYVRFRSGPSLDASVLDYLHTGTRVIVNGSTGSWYEVVYNGTVGYVNSSYLVSGSSGGTANNAPVVETPATETPAENPATEPTAPPTPAAPIADAGSAGQLVVDTAKQFLGVPYIWGGTSPDGFDCSGLVYYVYGQLGYSINRVAQSMYYNGVDVSLDNLQPGDILCFGSSIYNIWHVGIYVGNDQFIHSPYSGQVVSIETLGGNYGGRLVAARRIV